MLKSTLPLLFSIPQLALAATTGTVQSLDGEKFSGEIEFSKAEVTIRSEDGQQHRLPIGQLQIASIDADANTSGNEPEPPTNGLRGRYYSNIKHEDDPVERIDASISFDWGETAPVEGVRPNGFSVRWEGEVACPVGGEITFEVESDDGCRLWVDDKLLIDHWEAQDPTARRASIRLQADKRYGIKLEYYDAWNNAIARLRWTAEGLPLELIPTDQLFPLPTNAPIPEEFKHAVHLRSISSIRGTVISADRRRVQLRTPHGLVSIPTPAVRYIVFTENWGSELAGVLQRKPPGVAYLNRDFAEAKFIGLESGTATFESVLFGKLEVPQSELRAIKLAEFKPRPTAYWILTRSDTRIAINSIESLPDNRVKVRDASGYHLSIPTAEIRQVRIIASPAKKNQK